jgi:hypothetical protein
MSKKNRDEKKVTVNGDKIIIPNAASVVIASDKITVWWRDGTWTNVKPGQKSSQVFPNPDYYPGAVLNVPPIRPTRYEITLTKGQLEFLKAVIRPMGDYLGGTPMGLKSVFNDARSV